MIVARIAAGALAARLIAKAASLAEAHAGHRGRHPRRWRRAQLLWPLFAKER